MPISKLCLLTHSNLAPNHVVPLNYIVPLLVRLTIELAPARPIIPAYALDLLRIELTIAK